MGSGLVVLMFLDGSAPCSFWWRASMEELEAGFADRCLESLWSAAVAIGYDGSFSAYCEQLCLQTPHVLCGPGFGGSGDGGF